jgi:hypothetical protein
VFRKSIGEMIFVKQGHFYLFIDLVQFLLFFKIPKNPNELAGVKTRAKQQLQFEIRGGGGGKPQG